MFTAEGPDLGVDLVNPSLLLVVISVDPCCIEIQVSVVNQIPFLMLADLPVISSKAD